MIRAASIILVSGVCLVACGPVSPELAADQCEEKARQAAGPTGKAEIGINSNREATSSISIGVSSDFLLGKDPRQVYDDCVFQKTGQGPIRPLRL